MSDELDLDLDNYKLSELLNIYQLSELPNDEITLDMIFENKIRNTNVSLEIKNFLFNVKMRLKMEVREKIRRQSQLSIENKKEKVIDKMKIGKETRSTYLCIDSRFRDNYYKTESNDFIIDLPYEFNNVTKLSLLSIEIVNSVTTLTIEDENSFFDISCNSDDTSGNFLHRIQVADGNYTHTDFQQEINERLKDAIGVNQIEVTFDKKTGKTMIRARNPEAKFNIYFGENKQEPFNTLGYKMGFRNRSYFERCDLESESLFDLTGEKYFFVYVDDYNHNFYRDTIISVQADDYLTKNILGRITMAGDTYQVLYEDTSDLIRKDRIYSGPVNIKKLHIKLLNVYGNKANINEIDYSLIFEIVQKTTS